MEEAADRRTRLKSDCLVGIATTEKNDNGFDRHIGPNLDQLIATLRCDLPAASSGAKIHAQRTSYVDVRRTFSARGPFGPSPTSNSTESPSRNRRSLALHRTLMEEVSPSRQRP